MGKVVCEVQLVRWHKEVARWVVRELKKCLLKGRFRGKMDEAIRIRQASEEDQTPD